MWRNSMLALLLACAPAFGQAMQAGEVTRVTALRNGAELQVEPAALARVEFVDAGIIRVRFNPLGRLTDVETGAVLRPFTPEPAVTVVDNSDAVILLTGKAIVTVMKRPFRVIILRADRSVVMEDTAGGIVWDRTTGAIVNRKVARPGEAYFGLGARGGPINRRGRSFVMRNVDYAAYGELTDPLYISIPFFYGLLEGKAYGLFFDNPAQPVFDMDSDKSGFMTIGAASGELDYYVMTGPTPLDVARGYAMLTGNTPAPPKWALGYHQSRYSYESEAAAMEVAERFRRLKIPCDVLWFDIDYMDAFKTFTFSPERFPDPGRLVRHLDGLGFRKVFIVEPLMLNDDPLWAQARDEGYLIKNADGTTKVSSIWYGDVSFIDFTSPRAREWYLPRLMDFLRLGVDGVWNDLNEPSQNFMPQAVYDFYGQNLPDDYARNLYALHQLSLTYEAMRKTRPDVRPWAISRAGYAGIQRYAANWSGDINSTFDSLRVSVQMTISMGLSGQNFFGHDIGGFLGSPDAELMTRWMQFGSFIPLFRNHATKNTAPREPWAFGEPAAAMLRGIIEARYRLLPYIYSLFHDLQETSRPVVAPLFFDYPDDANTYSQDSSFLLGPSLLIAPVVEAGATARDVYFPKGANWIDRSTGQLYAGGTTARIEAPIDRIPVFVKENAVIPSGPVMQYTDEPVAREILWDFYGNSQSIASGRLYEDDGKSYRHLAGDFLVTSVTRFDVPGYVLVGSRRTSGAYDPGPRTAYFHLHRMTQTPVDAVSGSERLPRVDCSQIANQTRAAWCYDGAARKAVVRTSDRPDLSVVLLTSGTAAGGTLE